MSDRTTGKKSRTANYITTMTSEPQDYLDEETIKKNYIKLLKEGKSRVHILFDVAAAAKINKHK